MRIVFMGTPEFSVPTLNELIASEHEVVGIVTQPDKPKGRGKEQQFSAVKKAGLEANIPIFQPVKVRDSEFIETLRGMEIDVIIVVAFGQILPESILNMPKYGCINVHASLLPKYRGAAPIQWAVIDGEKETGVTAMYMEKGLDTGDMIKKVKIEISNEAYDGKTADSLHDKLAALGGKLILDVLKELEENTAVREKQDDSLSTYAKMLTKEMGCIDWNQDAVGIERLIRGLNSWPSAYTYLGGKTLKIWRARIEKEIEEKEAQCGEVLKIEKDFSIDEMEIWVQTGKGILVLKEVQLEGKKRVPVKDFLNGHKLEEGMVLGIR